MSGDPPRNVRDRLVPEAGAFYVMDRAYLDFERLHALAQMGAFLATRSKSNMDARCLYWAPTERSTGLSLRPDNRAQRFLFPPALSAAPASHPIQGPRNSQDH